MGCGGSKSGADRSMPARPRNNDEAIQPGGSDGSAQTTSAGPSLSPVLLQTLSLTEHVFAHRQRRFEDSLRGSSRSTIFGKVGGTNSAMTGSNSDVDCVSDAPVALKRLQSTVSEQVMRARRRRSSTMLELQRRLNSTTEGAAELAEENGNLQDNSQTAAALDSGRLVSYAFTRPKKLPGFDVHAVLNLMDTSPKSTSGWAKLRRARANRSWLPNVRKEGVVPHSNSGKVTAGNTLDPSRIRGSANWAKLRQAQSNGLLVSNLRSRDTPQTQKSQDILVARLLSVDPSQVDDDVLSMSLSSLADAIGQGLTSSNVEPEINTPDLSTSVKADDRVNEVDERKSNSLEPRNDERTAETIVFAEYEAEQSLREREYTKAHELATTKLSERIESRTNSRPATASSTWSTVSKRGSEESTNIPWNDAKLAASSVAKFFAAEQKLREAELDKAQSKMNLALMAELKKRKEKKNKPKFHFRSVAASSIVGIKAPRIQGLDS